jgi:long-subunit fatty acid transport protein
VLRAKAAGVRRVPCFESKADVKPRKAGRLQEGGVFMKKKLITGLVVSAVFLIGLPPRGAHASVAELFGVGPKAVAMGGAFTAVADDHSATWYNPAGLTQPASIQASAGVLFVNYDLKVNRAPRPIRSRGGMYIGVVAPLFHGNGAAGVWGYYPQAVLQTNKFQSPAEPNFPLDENRGEIFDLSPALAYDFTPKFSFGAGFRLISNQKSRLDMFLPLAFNSSAEGGSGDVVQAGSGELIVEVKNRITPVMGVLWRPYENLRLGATWRYFTRQHVQIDNEVSTITTSSVTKSGFIATLLSQDAIISGRFQGYQFYSPNEISFGVAYDPSPRLTLAANLDWELWSEINDNRIDGNHFAPFNYKLGAPEPLLINFIHYKPTTGHNIVIPRFGFEWRPPTKRGPLGPVDFQVRGGYAFRPAVFRDDQGAGVDLMSVFAGPAARGTIVRYRSLGTNDLDADRHILSVGLGMTIDDPVGWAEKWQFDFWWQQQILRGTNFKNQQFLTITDQQGSEFYRYGSKLHVNGSISAAGVFFTAKF